MKVEALSSPPEEANRIYDNKALMALLGIKDRYLKRLRDNGLLGYSRHGDKYWYSQADIYRYLSQCHCAPFGCDKSRFMLYNIFLKLLISNFIAKFVKSLDNDWQVDTCLAVGLSHGLYTRIGVRIIRIHSFFILCSGL